MSGPVIHPENGLFPLTPGIKHHAIEPDRKNAIGLAIKNARPGDCVLIAGKGHETYQIFKTETIDFDDRMEARKVLGTHE
jgi:UDP-N-acetylmuramyl tripeptide synthase